MSLYIKAKGIEGNSTTKGYEKWIEAQHVQFSAERRSYSTVGHVSSRNNSIPKFSNVTLIKKLDQASNDFFEQALNGEIIPSMEIHQVIHSDAQPQMKLILSDVMVSSQEHSIGSDGSTVETVVLSYSKIERTFIGRDSSGKTVSPMTKGYNLETAQMC